MTEKISLRLGIAIHLILLNLVVIEWVLFWSVLDALSSIGFGIVSLALAISLTNKIGQLINGGTPDRRFTITLLAYSIWSLDWWLFEPKDAGLLTEFSMVVIVIEAFLYGVFHRFKQTHIALLVANLAFLMSLRIYPNLALSLVTVTPEISAFFKIEAILCWIVCLSVVAFVASNKEKISKGHHADREGEWYGNLFGLISHNIKTPLTTIQQTLSIIKLRSKEGELYFNDSLLNRLDQSSTRATTLVTELMNKAKLTQLKSKDQISVERFIADWCNENESAIYTYSPWMRQSMLSRHEQLSFSIAFDALKNNSIQAGASIIHLCSYENNSLSFVDNGTGMTSENISSFGKPISNSKNGAGLGTFFSKEIMLNSGWIMEAKPNENGARVDLNLPDQLVQSSVFNSL